MRELLTQDTGEQDYTRFAGILERVEFRDWRWRLGIEFGRCWLQIEFDAPDNFEQCGVHEAPGEYGMPRVCERGQVGCSRRHESQIQRGRKWFLSSHMTDSEVVQTALVAVLAAMEHETREDFRYRGEAIFGPHYNVEALVALAAGDHSDVRAA